MRLPRLEFAAGMAAVLGLLAAPALAEYPEKPVTILVAWSAGGATDLIARNMQPAVAAALGGEVVVKNVSGAAGTIGTAEAASAKPDGYTVLHTPAGPMTLQPHLRKIPYDLDSFAPVCRISSAPLALMVPTTSKYRTIKDIVEGAKAAPGAITYGSAGVGTLPHVSMVGLEQAAGIRMKHVPFRGSAEEMKALIGGTVDLVTEQSNLVPRYELHAVAIWSDERSPEFPDTPTVKEQGYDLTFSNWNAWFVPKDTPAEIVRKLAEVCRTALEDPAVKDGMQKMQTPIAYLGPEDAGAFFQAEYAKNGTIAAAAGLVKK